MNHRGFSPLGYLCGVLVLLTTAPGSGQNFNLDGYMTPDEEPGYSNRQAFYFFNGHGDQDVYGTMEDPTYQTYVYWGQGKLASDPTGPDYFFMYIETPIEAKNMVWGDGMTPQEISEYGEQLDFNKATGSEYMSFVLPSGDGGDNPETYPFWSYLEDDKWGPGSSHSGSYGAEGWENLTYGFINAKSSANYILDNGLGTTSSSANHDIGMAFEYQFALDSAENNALLDILRVDGGVIEYHLSPERGGIPTQVPEPSVLILALLGGLILPRNRA